MGFIWKVEEQELRKHGYKQLKYAFDRDEKIEAIDTYGNFRDKLADIIEKKALYDEAIANGEIKSKNTYSGVVPNTNSLKAWCKRNGVFDGGDYSRPTNYYFDGVILNFSDYTMTGKFLDDTIDKIFDSMLFELKWEETKYFKEHDEYSITCNKLEEYVNDYYYKVPEGIHLSFWSSGEIDIYENEDNKETTNHEITLEEAQKLIKFYEGLDKVVKEYYNNNIVDIEF